MRDSSHRHRVARRQGVRLMADPVDADSNRTRGRPLFEPSNKWIFITLDESHDATGTMRAGQRVICGVAETPLNSTIGH